MAKQTRFYLNALTDNHRLPTPTRGAWTAEVAGHDFLQDFAGDIRIDGNSVAANRLHSVPSLYARAIQFDQALENPTGPGHQELIGEWRGLLSIFALKDWCDIGLSVEMDQVQAPAENEQSAVGPGAGDLHYRASLFYQLPEPATEWRQWWRIYCGTSLVGATSPWTMVYTAVRYHAPESIPWVVDGHLCDPIRVYAPSGHGRVVELAILHRWVTLVLQASPWNLPPALATKQNTITAALRAWQTDLDRFKNADVLVPALLPNGPIERSPYGKFLVHPEVKSVPALEEMTLSGTKPVVPITPDTWTGEERAWNWVLTRQIDVKELAHPSGEELVLKDGKRVPVGYLFPDELFFSDKLAEVETESAALRGGTPDFALPLTADFFKYFSPGDFERSDILQTQRAGDKVIATLRLPLSGGRVITRTREYDLQSDKITLEEAGGTPGLALWPDFVADDWHEYWAGFAAQVDARKDELQVQVIAEGGVTLPDLGKADRSQQELRSWRHEKPLLGFQLLFRAERARAAIRAGVIIRSARAVNSAKPLALDRTWDLAVDFGTSNTMLSIRENSQAVKPLVLKGRATLLTTPRGEWDEPIRTFFHPSYDVTPPFSTLLYSHRSTMFGGTQSGENALAYQYTIGSDQPIVDVKWGGRQGRDQTAIKDYLSALMRHVIAEARDAGAGRVNVRWSYPLSLPDSPRNAMQAFWSTLSGTRSYSDVEVRSMGSLSESESLWLCLKSFGLVFGAAASSLTIGVDVGGGSTDIAYWSKEQLLDVLSLKLAGNDVLTPKLSKLAAFLPEVHQAATGNPIPQGEIERATDNTGNSIPIYLNGLFGRAIEPSGSVYRGADPWRHPVTLRLYQRQYQDTPWLEARTAAFVFFAGIAYFLGVQSSQHLKDRTAVTVYIGGKGSSLLTWIEYDAAKVRALLIDAFSLGLKNAKFTQPVEIRFAGPALDYQVSLPPMKHEVAHGLMVAEEFQGKPIVSETTLVGDDGWTMDGDSVSWAHRATRDELLRLAPPRTKDGCPLLRAFLAWAMTRQELGIDTERLKPIATLGETIQHFEQALAESTASSSGILEPVFALELKTVLRRYIESVTSIAGSAAAGR